MNKKKKDSLEVKISNGKAVFIYNDELVELLKEGPSHVERASNVEPVTSNIDGKEVFLGWWAYMKDGNSLGPYKTRQECLDAEVEYLKEKMFG